MDWNRNGMNGVISSHENHQYLPVSTSSTVQSNSLHVPQRAGAQAGQHHSKGRYIRKLLSAKSPQELLQIQQSAIKSSYRSAQMHQVNQMSTGQYNSYQPRHETIPTSNGQNGLNVQGPATSNYVLVPYTNAVQQTPQQPQLAPSMPPYDANGYHVRERQQTMQNGQANVAYTYSHQNVAQPAQNVFSNIRQPANAVQAPYLQVPKNNSPAYPIQNGDSGLYVNSHKVPTETNVPVNSQDYRNSQTGGNFSTVNYVNVLPQQLQTVPQWNGNGINYIQRPLMQEVHNAVPNSSQAVATSTNAPPMQMPPPYTQGLTNQSNVLNGPMNPQLVNQNQSYVVQNVQQPIQAVKGPQDQSSSAPLPQTQGGSALQDQNTKRQNLQHLLQVYRSVKQKYLLLNHENNLLRQKLKAANASQENASPAPLICTLPNALAPANGALAGQQNLAQTAPLQNQSPLTTANSFPAQNACINPINVPAQTNSQSSQTLPGNGYLPNQVCMSSDRNVLDQNNCLVLEGGQMNAGSCASSDIRAQSPEYLNTRDHQNKAAKDSLVYTNSNNQSLSSGSSGNVNVSQNEHPVNTPHSRDQTYPVASERLNTATCPPKTGYDYTSYYPALLNAESHSREAIEAALPLWKSVPQISSPNKDEATGPEGQQPFAGLTVDSISLLEQTLTSKNETASVVSPQKPKLSASNASKCVARVYPLVQSKELVHKETKLVLKDEDLENHSNDNISFNIKENECIKELLHALRSVDGPPLNIENISTEERPTLPTSVTDQSLNSNSEVSAQQEVDQNSPEDIEMADNDFKISGVCTLVEGSSFYDSSIALIFDDPIKTECDATFPDNVEDHALQHSEHTVDEYCDSEAKESSSLNTDVSVEAQSSENKESGFGLASNENLHESGIPCFEMQNDNSELCASNVFCDLDDSPGSDQLSELLTAFPFGIKNYMSENKLEAKESVEKLAEQPVIPKVSLPVIESQPVFDSDKQQPAFDSNMQNQHMPPTSPNVCILGKEIELENIHEPTKDPQPIIERVPTPNKDAQTPLEEMPPTDDCFEIICDSPENSIQITLLDQDDIPKLFPDVSEKLLTPKCEPIETEISLEPACTKESKDPVLNVQLNPLKKENTFTKETTALPNKDLFCCLFSWLDYINGNAPKCRCKANQSPINSVHVSEDLNAVVTETSGNVTESSLPNSSKAEGSGLVSAILSHNDKLPRLSPVAPSSQHRSSLQYRRCSSQEETKLIPSPEVGLKKNKELTHAKSFQPSPELASRPKSYLQNKKPKSSNSPKSEKLIVKTDFLKNKSLKKEKRKHKAKKKVKDALGAYDTRGNLKKVFEKIDEQEKRLKQEIARRVKSKESSYTTQHTDRSMNKSMPSLSLARSTPTDTGHKLYDREKKKPESHSEKTRKVLTLPQYLERKRKLCNRMSEIKLNPNETIEGRHTFDDKPLRSSGYNSLPNLKKPLSPAKMNVASKTRHSESDLFKVSNRTSKDRPQSSGPHEIIKHSKEQMQSSGREKIYLTPCIGSRGPPCEGLSLTKLQIRCSPEKRGYFERRKSDSSLHRKSSKSEVKKTESPKMLEFKLCPEFIHRSLAIQENPEEPKTSESKSVVEGIKSKKEAWCSGIPFKKRKLESFEDKGSSGSSVSPISIPTYKPLERGTTRPVQDSRTTFNAFKRMYHEQQSKSLDGSLGNL